MLQEGVRLLKSPPEGMWTWGGSGREGVSPQTGGAGNLALQETRVRPLR